MSTPWTKIADEDTRQYFQKRHASQADEDYGRGPPIKTRTRFTSEYMRRKPTKTTHEAAADEKTEQDYTTNEDMRMKIAKTKDEACCRRREQDLTSEDMRMKPTETTHEACR